MTTTLVRLPRETVEYLVVPLTVDGVAVTAYSVEMVPTGERPTTWTTAVSVGGGSYGYLLTDHGPGMYDVYARYVAGAETMIRFVGNVELT